MRKIILSALFLSGLLSIIDVSLAQYALPVKPSLAPFTGVEANAAGGQGAAATASTLNLILNVIAGGLIYLATPIAIFMIAFYGLRIKMGQESYEGAKKGLIWSVVGLVIIMLSVVIIRTVITVIISADDPVSNAVEKVEKAPGAKSPDKTAPDKGTALPEEKK